MDYGKGSTIQTVFFTMILAIVLVSGLLTLGNIFQGNSNANNAEVARNEYRELLRTTSEDLKTRIEREREAFDSDSNTKDRRIRILEERADNFERELKLQRKEFEIIEKEVSARRK